jgi:SET domain-containing protein
MLTVKTKIGPSKIAGIGLFADEMITKGTVIWKFEPLIDILLSKEEIENLAEPSKKQFYNYSYLDEKYNKYLLCGDDGRFLNHDLNPNCDDSIPDETIAIRNIAIGEELTVNYKVFIKNLEDHFIEQI